MLLGLLAALLAAVPAIADPRAIEGKRAEAEQVMAQIQETDSRLGRAVEQYNLANVRLDRIRADLRENAFELKIAKGNLATGQKRLAQRVVDIYTSASSAGAVEVILGAESLDDLLNRFETVDRVSTLDAQVATEVRTFRDATQKHKRLLAQARAAQERVVAQRAAEKRSIEGQLAERERLLASIKDQIVQMEAAERARQEALARAARARVAAMQAAQAAAADPNPSVAAAAAAPIGPIVTPTDDVSVPAGDASVTAAPPASTHGGIVGVAMSYLGVPYVWGGGSPGGFDCSGLVSYAYSRIGVSVPHSTYALYAMGSAVSRDQLQPGDLVFFDGLGHMGIYIGGGQFVHAPHTGDVVKVSSLGEGWYASSYVGARRI